MTCSWCVTCRWPRSRFRSVRPRRSPCRRRATAAPRMRQAGWRRPTGCSRGNTSCRCRPSCACCRCWCRKWRRSASISKWCTLVAAGLGEGEGFEVKDSDCTFFFFVVYKKQFALQLGVHPASIKTYSVGTATASWDGDSNLVGVIEKQKIAIQPQFRVLLCAGRIFAKFHFLFCRGLTDESEILKFLQHGTLVGLLPVPHPILIRKYQANSGTTMWFRTYTWGVIYLRLVSL